MHRTGGTNTDTGRENVSNATCALRIGKNLTGTNTGEEFLDLADLTLTIWQCVNFADEPHKIFGKLHFSYTISKFSLQITILGKTHLNHA